MKTKKTLPPGQNESELFPRFGLAPYANRFPNEIDRIHISIGGDLEEVDISDDLKSLRIIDQVSDFHCVTTWSKLNLKWSGYRFKDFYEYFIKPKLSTEITFVVLKSQDGYKTSLPLKDLLQDNVMLATQLDNEPLSIEHGAPIRIIAPDHYGYKSLKHIKGIDFYAETQQVKQGLLSFMDHPRARVAREERAKNGPQILFRWLYRSRIKSTIRKFEEAMQDYRLKKSSI